MQSLNRMIDAGKVLYLGISDTPAWVVAKANEYARSHGLTQFSILNAIFSPCVSLKVWRLLHREHLGKVIFKSADERQSAEGRKGRPPTEKDTRVSEKLEEIATEEGTTITSVVRMSLNFIVLADSLLTFQALAYVMHKALYVYPIVGCRKWST
jgi:aryl-alcohol dehydrogenase-like predicted oxidoreductase